MRAKHGVALTVLALAFLSLTGCQPVGQSRASAHIVIAADLELTGAQAAVGNAYQRALQLEVDRVNTSGTLGDRSIRLVVRDNQSDVNVSAINVSELTQDPNLVAVIAGPCAECLVASTRTLNSRRVPTLALTSVDEVTAQTATNQYLFRVGPNTADDAGTLVDTMADDGARKIGIIAVDDLYGKAAQRGIVDLTRKAGIAITGQATINPANPVTVQPVQKVVDDHSDALLILAYPEQAAQLAVVARAAGYQGRLYFDAPAAGNLFLTGAASTATEGSTLIFPQILGIDDLIATNPAKADRRRWFGDYTAKYGEFQAQAAFAADAVRMLVDAISASTGAGTPDRIDRERVRAQLETTRLDGLSGPLRFTPINHSALGPQAMTTFVAHAGRWRLAGTATKSTGRT